LQELDLLECEGDIEIYLKETFEVYNKFAPLLLVSGGVCADEPDVPLKLKDPFDMLSFLHLDGGGNSKLAVHTDTDQVSPCVCSCDSLYPEGLYDVKGAELLVANGVWGEPYGRRDAIVLAGHTVHHTLLPLSHGPRKDGLPMLRGSIVHWSHAGRELVEEWRHYAGEEAKEWGRGYTPPQGAFWNSIRSQSHMGMHMHLGGELEGPHSHNEAPLWQPDSPVLARVLGPVGLNLRLRGVEMALKQGKCPTGKNFKKQKK
jgi:hypothetical protein